MWRISNLADIRPMGGISFHAMVVFGLGKNILFKSMLGSCAPSNSPQSTSHETPFESIIISQQTPIETLNLSPT